MNRLCDNQEMRNALHILLLAVFGLALAMPALAADPDLTAITVEVMNDRDKPIPRASVIVRFVEGRSVVKLGKKIITSYELRTSNEGKVTVPPIPQGKILIQVIAKGYQTYGDYHEIYEDEKTIPIVMAAPAKQYSSHEDSKKKSR
ncbi:MAG: carboxypeptidase regulatory-like domain-containing protein [Bryobacterales bacterium]|nr:carboxypeptidase regulatory-like domain-containing protein [Bryobacterales bacterium]